MRLILIPLLALTACGPDKVYTQEPTPQPTILINLPPQSPTDDSESASALIGYHTLPETGYIELLKMADNRLLIYSGQRIITTNADQSLAQLPTIPQGPYSILNGEITTTFSVAFSATHGFKKDSDNANVLGNRTVTLTISRPNNVLQLHIRVYNGLTLETDREVLGQ